MRCCHFSLRWNLGICDRVHDLRFSAADSPKVGLQYTVNFEKQYKVAKNGTLFTGIAVQVFTGKLKFVDLEFGGNQLGLPAWLQMRLKAGRSDTEGLLETRCFIPWVRGTEERTGKVKSHPSRGAQHCDRPKMIEVLPYIGWPILFQELRGGKSVSKIRRSSYANPVGSSSPDLKLIFADKVSLKWRNFPKLERPNVCLVGHSNFVILVAHKCDLQKKKPIVSQRLKCPLNLVPTSSKLCEPV